MSAIANLLNPSPPGRPETESQQPSLFPSTSALRSVQTPPQSIPLESSRSRDASFRYRQRHKHRLAHLTAAADRVPALEATIDSLRAELAAVRGETPALQKTATHDPQHVAFDLFIGAKFGMYMTKAERLRGRARAVDLFARFAAGETALFQQASEEFRSGGLEGATEQMLLAESRGTWVMDSDEWVVEGGAIHENLCRENRLVAVLCALDGAEGATRRRGVGPKRCSRCGVLKNTGSRHARGVCSDGIPVSSPVPFDGVNAAVAAGRLY
jgi:hypothetical protein